jgi:hypothetical protein
MGLFDDVFTESSPKSMTKQEAFMGVLLCANASDGHVSDEEARGLFTILGRMKLYENWTDEKWRRALDRLTGALRRQGVEPVLKECVSALPEPLHKTVFANACDLVMADGVVEDEEKEFINKLWRLLGISGDDAKTIAQVMVIKNRG